MCEIILLAGDESAGGVPMFDFQLNSRVFGISVTDNVNMNAKNSMDLGVGSGNFNVNAKGKNEIIGETVVISQNIIRLYQEKLLLIQ